jgi:hypothetical protein
VIALEVRHRLAAILQLPILRSRFPLPRSRKFKWATDELRGGLGDDPAAWGTLLGWLFTHALGRVVAREDFEQVSRSWTDEWLLGKIIAGTLQGLGLDEVAAWQSVALIKLLIGHREWMAPDAAATDPGQRAYAVLHSWLQNSEAQAFLGLNRYQGILWFNQESFEELVWWLLTLAAVEISAGRETGDQAVAEEIVAWYDVIRRLRRAQEASGYRVERLLEAARA